MLTGLPAGDTTTTETATATVPSTTNGYIVLPVTIDPNQLIADAFAFIQEQIPGWLPYEGQLEAWLVEACAQMVAAYAQVAAQVPISIFEYLGALLFNLPPNAGTASQAPTTWTMVDDQGYTVPAGTVVGFQTNGNTYTLFQTTADFSVATGSTETSPGAVVVQALEAGSANNGIAAGSLVLADSLSYVSSIISTEVTSGGADAETTAAYISRLSNQLTLITPRPVYAADFALMTIGQQGCARALGIDNFDASANMLVPPDDGTGSAGAGSWDGVTNCSVASSTAQLEASTTQSLAITATAEGAFLATTNDGDYPVSPGSTYVGSVGMRAASTTESLSAVLRWKSATGTVLSTTTGTAASDTSSGWTTLSVSGTAPTNAATVEIGVSGTAAAADEVHYAGQRQLAYVPYGGSAPSWAAGGQMTGQERMVTVVPVDDDGDALSPEAMSAISTYLEGLREQNFVVNVAPPTYAAISVEASVVAIYGADPDSVQSLVESALQSYLDQANWAGGTETPAVWLNDQTVYYLSVANVINSVTGVHHVPSLTLNGSSADVVMPGYASLPAATVNVSVTVAAQGT